jgi:hypothetical protein
MIQKFLKSDGSIEEGEPLTEAQSAFFVALQEYLHVNVCRHTDHYSEKPCVEAARLITVVTTTIDQSEWGEVFEEKNAPKAVEPEPPAPEPVSAEPIPAEPAKDDYTF